MQSLLVQSAVVLCLVAGSAVAFANQEDEFEVFVRKFNKNYQSPIERTLRMQTFLKNKELIEKFNREQADALGYRLGLSHLSDLTQDEVAVRRGLKTSLIGADYRKGASRIQERRGPSGRLQDWPDHIDWRDFPDRVTPVKDQGQCGSCWAFSATGALEGRMAVMGHLGKMVSLSEQNLIDCSPNNNGCEGGLMSLAWLDIHNLGGIESESDYPYEARDGSKCRFNSSKSIVTDYGYVTELMLNNEDELKNGTARFGPFSIGVDASHDSFTHYASGVYFEPKCSNKLDHLNHAMLIVGYGVDNATNQDYWLLKNSWGTHWGEQGYMRLARNRDNHCGVATMASAPLMVP